MNADKTHTLNKINKFKKIVTQSWTYRKVGIDTDGLQTGIQVVMVLSFANILITLVCSAHFS